MFILFLFFLFIVVWLSLPPGILCITLIYYMLKVVTRLILFYDRMCQKLDVAFSLTIIDFQGLR